MLGSRVGSIAIEIRNHVLDGIKHVSYVEGLWHGDPASTVGPKVGHDNISLLRNRQKTSN
jgi:hypothetical protein